LYDKVYTMLRATDLIPPLLENHEERSLKEQVFWLFHSCYEARLLDAPVRLLPLFGVLGHPGDTSSRIEFVQARIIDDIVNGKVPEENLHLIKKLLEKYLKNTCD
jgi:hypothetical protein